jgi:hypothetical protein
MKLSEAIRLGAMLKPQAFGDYTDGVGTCAIGAANEAIGSSADINTTHWESFLDMSVDQSSCPVCARSARVFEESLIVHLNDDHRWTREQIADWVETIEQQHESTQAAPVAVEVVR